MLAQGIKLHFAHRTFSWSNEARGKAAVHCVIIGFGLQEAAEKIIYEYEDIKGEPHAVRVSNINPYLVDATNFILPKLSKPFCDVSPMRYGSKPADGGNLILTSDERDVLIKNNPEISQLVKTYIGSEELINNRIRHCLWLKGQSPQSFRNIPEVMSRVAAVQKMRLASTDKNTQEWASRPSEFQTDRQPMTDYLAIPEVSSERRRYLPIAFLQSNVVASNLLYTIENATPFLFGILTSTMHNAWVRSVCGRLESRYRYSAGIVYNNFPWPEPTEKQTQSIEACAQAVLDARAAHPNASLADLYDPLTMPANLLKAHQVLDKAVDAAYGYKGANTDAARVAFLFALYQKITSLLPVDKPKKSKKS